MDGGGNTAVAVLPPPPPANPAAAAAAARASLALRALLLPDEVVTSLGVVGVNALRLTAHACLDKVASAAVTSRVAEDDPAWMLVLLGLAGALAAIINTMAGGGSLLVVPRGFYPGELPVCAWEVRRE